MKWHQFLLVPVKYLWIGMGLWLNDLALCQQVKEEARETDIRCKCDSHNSTACPHPLPTQTRGRKSFLLSLNKQLDTGLNICIHRRLCLPQGLFGRARHDPLITYCLLPRGGQLYSPRDQHPVPAIIDLLPPRWAKDPSHPRTPATR